MEPPLSPLEQGLLLSLLGFALTFAALALLVLTVVVLRRIFDAPAPSANDFARDGDQTAADDLSEIAAAVAAAVVILRAREQAASTLGQGLEADPGRWWQGPQAGPAPPKHGTPIGRTEA